ncbi:centromere protein M [Erpetoichthys calabaricus]|uniref:Centromere protein M n=1 Tax=Erpetoichthys calabaricus TaxID=27687 RepID=A0A8C4XG93_ERPCA|nr:centromere protein M [Erpetoichthys calabaricus]
MSVLNMFHKHPELNTASILLVETERQHQDKLAEAILAAQRSFNVNVHLADSLPLPTRNEANRPRIDLVVFIVNHFSSRSLELTKSYLQHLDVMYFLGRLCFLVNDARSAKSDPDKLHAVREMAAKYSSPLLFTELQTEQGLATAADRLLVFTKVSAGFVPGVSSLFLNTLTSCSHPMESSSNTLVDTD